MRNRKMTKPENAWRPDLSGDRSFYRSTPYEFAETSNSRFQVIQIEETTHVGEILVFRSPLTAVQSGSQIVVKPS